MRVLLRLGLLSGGTAGCASGSQLVRTGVPRAAGTVVHPRHCQVNTALTADGARVSAPVVIRCILPWYPEDLRRGGVSGEAVMQFPVDSAGQPDPSAVQPVRVSHKAFGEAVSRAVSYLRFQAAKSGEPRPVIVQMSFTFTIAR
jgi:TonB family protein